MGKIEVESRHTKDMVRRELQSMLGATKIRLTLGNIAQLALLESPYLLGGEITPEQILDAYSLIEHGDLEPVAFHAEIQDALDTAFRAFELIVPESSESNAKTSKIDIYSPEWFADIISQACRAMPSLTYQQVLYEVPLALVLHLSVSTARRYGAITERPIDMKDVINRFKSREIDNG